MNQGVIVRVGLRRRLRTVEVKLEELAQDVAETRTMAAKNDEDLAPFRQVMSGHTSVLNALRETQIEQGETLAEHGRTLAEHGKTLAEHGKTLMRLTATLDQHTATLDQHTATLDQHTATLDRHTATLDQHTAWLAAIMRHLGIAEDNGKPSGD